MMNAEVGHLSDESQQKLLLHHFAGMLAVLECPVCLDVFNDASHTPRLLCCGHTICQLCVERLVLSSSLPRHCLRCPECRAVCKWRGIQELPKNYILLHALAAAETTGDSTSPTYPANTTSTNWSRRVCFELLRSPVITLTGTNFIRLWLPGTLERKVWELVKMMGASMVLFILLPISILHLCFSWWTALLGFVVFSCFTVGVAGIALFLLLLWWTHRLVLLLHRLANFVFKPWIHGAKLFSTS